MFPGLFVYIVYDDDSNLLPEIRILQLYSTDVAAVVVTRLFYFFTCVVGISLHYFILFENISQGNDKTVQFPPKLFSPSVVLSEISASSTAVCCYLKLYIAFTRITIKNNLRTLSRICEEFLLLLRDIRVRHKCIILCTCIQN